MMKPRAWLALAMAAIASAIAISCALRRGGAKADFNYQIGRAMRDITGPAVGVQLFGFVRADQIDEGIHLRLRSRAFVIVDPASGKRLALAVVDLGSVTHELEREVIDLLRPKCGELYGPQNVVISATHTHAGPGGYWHYAANTPFGTPFLKPHFDALARGIADSILAAHEDLKPGKILLAQGRLENAGANRSRVAYESNPPEERARYDSNTDKEMTLLRLERAEGPIGEINWFAVHPTCMTFHNKLISGDHKGYAAWRFEKEMNGAGKGGAPFVAAFAQSNCGDVTGNLNLNNTGPGKDEFESTKIIGERQLAKARELFDSAKEKLEGPLDMRFEFVDFSRVQVADKFTHAGPKTTCPSAVGYSFAAGSTEDGGGHPLFKEGMLQRNEMIDSMISSMGNIPPPSDGCRECQEPKPILVATGEMKPPGQPQIIPLTVARIGRLALVCGPAEYTTMTGRRIRASVAEALGAPPERVVIAGYSNGYVGYVATKQEYDTQQYEGGHTLYGPWTSAAYQQEFARLAAALASGRAVEPGPTAPDIRGAVAPGPFGTAFDAPPPDGLPFGAPAAEPKSPAKRGERVEAAFWAGNPQNDFKIGGNYLSVERKAGGGWAEAARDSDWSTQIRWKQPTVKAKPINPYGIGKPELKDAAPAPPAPWQAQIAWDIPEDAAPGTYRIVLHAHAKSQDGALAPIEAASREFQVE